jgi:hypothetical protein
MKKVLLFSSLLFISCSPNGNYKNYLKLHGLPAPAINSFIHCYDYGCQSRAIVHLPSQTQKKLNALFTPAPKTPEAERKKIAKAIKIFEDDIGAMTGTMNDKHGTFRLYQDNSERYDSYQQDCVDESTNTTTYLGLLEEMGLLKFHRPVFAATRQPFLSGRAWWHQTAVIENIESGEKFAVDSWFRDNGHPAFIVPLKEWKNGWVPPKP